MTVLDDEEWEEFVTRIKAQENIPSFPTPTPNIENVKKVIKNYVRDKYNYRRQDIYT